MDSIDFILNVAGLLLWLNWRTLPFDPLTKTTPATLIGTLRRAEPTRFRRWHFAAALGILLVARAGFYWLIGPSANWGGTLNLIATRLVFRSDAFTLMLLYSFLSFGVLLGIFTLWLLLLSALSSGGGNQTLARLAKAHLGFVATWPIRRKLLLPFVAGFVLWWLWTWPLARWGLIPKLESEISRLIQAALVGLSTYLAWKYLIVALLAVYLLHNYLYFGRHTIWNFVDEVGRRLLRPVDWIPLRIGRVDFSPLVGIALVFLITNLVADGMRPPVRFGADGRPELPAWEIPGLQQLYERVSR